MLPPDFDKIPIAMQTAQDVKGTVNTVGAAAKAKLIKFDIAQTREFLTALYGDYFSKNRGFIEVRYKAEGEEMQRSFYPNPEALIKNMHRWETARNYWPGVAPRSNNRGGKKEDVAAMPVLGHRYDQVPLPRLGLGLPGGRVGLVQPQGGGLAVVLEMPNPRVARGPGSSRVTRVPERSAGTGIEADLRLD